MKFARYLEETQTPEWKKAYINYRGLKKHINAIRKAQERSESNDEDPDTVLPVDPILGEGPVSDEPKPLASTSTTATQPMLQNRESGRHRTASQTSHHTNESGSSERPNRPIQPQRSVSKFFGSRRKASFSTKRPADLNTPLMDLLPTFSLVERQFFDALDIELDKIESFYLDREKEAKARSAALKEQLQELKDHRRLFYEAQASEGHPFPFAFGADRFKYAVNRALPEIPRHWSRSQSKEKDAVKDEGSASDSDKTVDPQTTEKNISMDHADGKAAKSGSPNRKHNDEHGRRLDDDIRHNPEEYLHAKKKLKKAVLEHYRGLEVLNNYRILNLTGFRKALKKFEKVTKKPALQAYMMEKVEPSAFASGGKTVDTMMREMEELFTARFERGDKKKALERLRTGSRYKSHHFSTFRSGLAVGLSIPALVSGLYQSLQPTVRQEIVGWDALLFVYGILLIPVVFSFLVGLNLLVWSKARINYVFIFELEVRTRLDYREYFEIPSILLCALCYAFWLSFSRIGSNSLSPTLYPVIWLAFAAIIMFDPLPILFKASRWWLIKNVSRLLISGTRRVEFTDFWMGDQFCSLVFTLSNLYFVVCVYVHGYGDAWQRCASPKNWAVPFALSALPLLVRLVQSVKRWVDSRLITHLINGGKYGAGILMYGLYFNWRYHGSNREGANFALYCIFATIYSSYAASWDFLMDWSVLRPRSRAKYALLRGELLYPDHLPMYYFAIVTNVMIRFIWILYTPARGPNFVLRTFIAGMLEMLRRWQWNFYRLENEHLGNMDQYRVTREVPLPYSFDAARDDDGDDVDGDEENVAARPWGIQQWKSRAHGSKGSLGPEKLTDGNS